MNKLAANTALSNGVGSDVIELESGQCVVIQCHHDIGRTFIRSVRGEGVSSGCKISYRGKLLSLGSNVAARRVGFSCLDEGLYERLKVREYLLFWAELHGKLSGIGELLSQIGLAGKASERISKLSYSEKRLLGFARSILHDPKLLIWEDPEQNLDLESCMIVRRMIAELLRQDKAILVTCSTLEQALSISNRIFRLTGSSLAPIMVQEASEFNESESVPGDDEPEAASGEQQCSPRLAKLMVKTEDKYVFLDPGEVHFIESIEGVTHLYTQAGSFACSWTLAELEAKLKLFRFYRCHRSYIVNLDQIAELIVWSRNSYSLVLSDDKKSRIPLSKGKFEELKTIVGL
ncbi:transcriptional regulator, LytTR family [Paenibacillus algorifonticola]|uniref:Transcriptional regulator, LytTR family n=1 Tax=Paenibacillus algorifonticola TaxID=684063 RepID=A0A1I2J2Q3_9BACL|nr:LytTR family transcriptional regulator DNA-binding domain-containing protein [Paenibacillus algorifonticola]SFF47547.1 transcriptional regulator, LytTR family [Paenibacillus algorifonticola]